MAWSSPAIFVASLILCHSLGHATSPNSAEQRPLDGDYTGALRPQIHYSPPNGFMNDPNGLFVDAKGLYHLYYQYNPTANVAAFEIFASNAALSLFSSKRNGYIHEVFSDRNFGLGNQHWGHATSKDLYTWQNQPIALSPDDDGGLIFSGSCVIDVNNTSGFFPDQTDGVVAMYTVSKDMTQTQAIAYSKDGGYTFTKYDANPVISVGDNYDFRDPKVLWYAPTSSWVSVIAFSKDFVIGIYTSPDLKSWTHASNFSFYGLEGLLYECPNLVPIPMLQNASLPEPFAASNFVHDAGMFAMVLSINPGAPLGGSISQFFPGTFNGTHFSPQDSATRLTDFAKDNYAGQFFHNIPESSAQKSIAWASNWQYTNQVPTGQRDNFRSIMSLPRRQVLANTTRMAYSLLSYPVDLSGLHTTPKPLMASSELANSSISYSYAKTVPSGSLYFSLNITDLASSNGTGAANFTFKSSSSGETVKGGVIFGSDNHFWIDRGGIRGFDNPYLTDKFSTSFLVDADTRTFRLLGVIDRSILEIFLDNGVRTATVLLYPEHKLDTLVLGSNDLTVGTKVAASVWGLKGTWQ